MTDVRTPEDLARRQGDVVARWQLIRAGLSERSAECRVRGLQSVGDGVFLIGLAPPTQLQCWWAAVLSAPGTVLSHASAAACWGIRPLVGSIATVTRVGTRGREHSRGLHVSYSLTLRGQVTERDGLPITTVERTIIDLWPHLSARARARMLREALRLGLTSAPRLRAALRSHRGRRSVASLRLAVDKLSGLRLDRCKSDPEAWAVALIADAGRAMPYINAEIAGKEADLSWPAHRLIIELDGPAFHVLRDEDVRKMRIWQAAGFAVRRFVTDRVYDEPERFLALVPASNVGATPS